LNQIPFLYDLNLHKPETDWGFKTVPQKFAALGLTNNVRTCNVMVISLAVAGLILMFLATAFLTDSFIPTREICWRKLQFEWNDIHAWLPQRCMQMFHKSIMKVFKIYSASIIIYSLIIGLKLLETVNGTTKMCCHILRNLRDTKAFLNKVWNTTPNFLS